MCSAGVRSMAPISSILATSSPTGSPVWSSVAISNVRAKRRESPYEVPTARLRFGGAVGGFQPGGTVQLNIPTGAMLDSAKQTVAAFRQSLQEAIDYINTHEPETRAAIVKYTKQPEAVVAATPLPELQVTVHPEQVQFFIDLARHQGLIKSSPDAAKMIAP